MKSVPLDTLRELMLEVRNDSFLIDECLLLDAVNNSVIAALVSKGCSLSPEVGSYSLFRITTRTVERADIYSGCYRQTGINSATTAFRTCVSQ